LTTCPCGTGRKFRLHRRPAAAGFLGSYPAPRDQERVSALALCLEKADRLVVAVERLVTRFAATENVAEALLAVVDGDQRPGDEALAVNRGLDYVRHVENFLLPSSRSQRGPAFSLQGTGLD
jgi:hypothetical protein